MNQIIESRLSLIGRLPREAGVGHMAFDAGELFVVGQQQASIDVFHAVAGCTEPGIAGSRITCRYNYREGNSGDDSCSPKQPIPKNENYVYSSFRMRPPALADDVVK